MNASESGSAGRPAVLLVDDEPGLLDALRLGLEGEFDVVVATNAAEAEQHLATRPYAVMVSDHLMPGEFGFALLNRARERFPLMKRIMITGYFNPELISRSVVMAELAGCLMKPVHAAELAKAIRTALAS